ncbi:hypothetical protein DQT32_04730 [Salmonella enterica subsp. enterica serovar Braenderup]|nr:hypothetical protein [Salmonella enterica subsp. enterica serovar Braenderup]
MKLRAFTAEETDELLQKFKDIAEYAYSINEAAYNLLMNKFLVYTENFKPSLFHWRPRDFKYFVDKINHESVRVVNWNNDGYENYFRKELFSKQGIFIRGIYFYSCYTYYMEKYSSQTLTDEEKTILCDAASVTGFTLFGTSSSHDKYRNLVKYAHRPFEFDESDIGWLEQIEHYHEKAMQWKSNLPKN